MTEATTKYKSRIERIQEAHPDAREVWIQMLLVYKYKVCHEDPSTRGPDGVQIQLESYTDYLIRLTPQALRNEVARVSEFTPNTWDEIEDSLNRDDD